MLIRCESCGKMFDYDKQDGQCPACGAFAARPAAQAAPEAAPAPDFGPETGGLGGVRGTLRRPSAVRTAARRGSSLLWLRVALAGLGLVFFALSGLMQPPQADNTHLPDTIAAQAGQAVTAAGREMTFAQPQRLTGRTAGLPEGWQLYRVRVSAPELDDWNSRAGVAVSLYAGGGYWQMLEDYELERLWPELAEESVASYDLSGWDALDSWLYLAGPADETAVLCLEDQVLDEEYDPHTQTVITLDLDWEEASEA